MSESLELDEELLKELDAIPEISFEDLRAGAFAYKVGVMILKKEYPLVVEDENN